MAAVAGCDAAEAAEIEATSEHVIPKAGGVSPTVQEEDVRRAVPVHFILDFDSVLCSCFHMP